MNSHSSNKEKRISVYAVGANSMFFLKNRNKRSVFSHLAQRFNEFLLQKKT